MTVRWFNTEDEIDKILDDFYKAYPSVYAWWKENRPQTMTREQWKAYHRKRRIDGWFVERDKDPAFIHHWWFKGKRSLIRDFPPGRYDVRFINARVHSPGVMLIDQELIVL